MRSIHKIALGGGCHWCTEAVFQSLIGVERVAQGFASSVNENASFSEAVIVSYDPAIIKEEVLIKIHLLTHNSTVNHSFRQKYRSAIYAFSNAQAVRYNKIIDDLQPQFNHKLVTKVLPFNGFKPSREEITNYYLKNPAKPFCEKFITPKLKQLLETHTQYVKPTFVV